MSQGDEQKPLPRLDPRLRALYSLVREGARCADIGCDHGLLISSLAVSGRIRFGYACDVNQKPLEKAAFSLRVYGVEDRVKLLLGDGLSRLRAGECDDIVIAGMGGDLIWDIIRAPAWTRDPSLRFLLQPMTHPERLRQKLYENGFALLREQAVHSGRFVYSVMQAAYTGEPRRIDLALLWGGLLWQSPFPEAAAYFARLSRTLGHLCAGLEKQNSPELPAYRALLARVREKGAPYL